jgi:hypothetical protein
MITNDLTAPLGQGPRNRRGAVNIPTAQIIMVALGLFLGLFVLWAVVARDPSGGEPVAVAPADLRIAKKRRSLCQSRKRPLRRIRPTEPRQESYRQHRK